MTLASRTFKARTVRVQTATRLEVELDLDFGVTLNRAFLLDGFSMKDALEDERARAKHCLVILVGGKHLIIRPDPRCRPRWGRAGDLRACVYLRERVHGDPVGFIERGVEEAQGPVLEVSPYMRWLAERGFDVEDVKATMNGSRREIA